MLLGNIRLFPVMYGIKSSHNIRTFATVIERAFTVSQYCNLDVTLPCNISITPLDFHKYGNNNQVIVKLFNNEDGVAEPIEYEARNNCFRIFSSISSFRPTTKCSIEAPVTADIKINSDYGCIEVSNFFSSSISLETIGGNISASKCQSDKMTIISSSGDIILPNVLQAAEMCLITSKGGSIIADRLQGNVLIATTEHGNIRIGSSYCDNSTFTTKSGTMDLRNTHKNCNVYVGDNGKLNMSGFDGTLHVSISEGDATIQITRLLGNSDIKIIQNGTLLLKLMEDCLLNTIFKIESKELQVLDNINFLDVDENSSNVMLIDCKNSQVNVQKASLMEMFNLKTFS